MSNGPGTSGFSQYFPGDSGSDFNKIAFQTKQMMARMRTMVPVKIIGVQPQSGTGTATQGDIAGAGFVSVQPVVSMVDGGSQSVQHGTIYNIPYTRIYGGTNAVIMDPAVGDIGYMMIADRDISSFKQNVVNNSGGSSGSGTITPGSNRKFDLADGIYIGGVLNKTPTQYITFTGNGVTIADKNGNTIVMSSSGVNITATNIYLTGTVYLGGQSANKRVGMFGTADTNNDTLTNTGAATKAFAL